jgi:hypothetical protein
MARQKRGLFMEHPWGESECRVDEVDQKIRRSEDQKMSGSENVLIA